MDTVQKPLVSIITASYNHFDHIKETIESVLSQDYENIEYIITDDGSSNFPEKELRALLDTKRNTSGFSYTIIKHEKNVGTVENLNQAFKLSKGDFVFNLSANDIFFNNHTVSQIVTTMLQEQAKLLVASRMAYTGNTITCLRPHYNERKIIEKIDTCKKQYKAFITSQFYDMASGSAMYFSRDVLEEFHYFDKRYRLWEDGPFLAKYLWKYPLSFHFEIISILYEDDGISSKRHSVNKILQKDIDFFAQNERYDHINEADLFTRRYIEYSSSRSKAAGKTEIILLYIKYFPQVISYFIYKLRRQHNEKRDRLYIKKNIKISNQALKIKNEEK